ncbi:MAG: hypothetical protein ACLSS9_09870 [Acutalibacteraceae bacterium]
MDENMLTLALERLDFGDEAEIDINGKAYNDLIDACFEYSKFFSFTVFEKDLDDFRPYLYKIVTEPYCYRPNKHYKTYFYLCCDAAMAKLKSPQYSLFYWTGAWLTPENLSFYRSDGSILLASIAHDQNCYVFIRDENIDDFMALAKWQRKDMTPLHSYEL